MNLIYLFFLDDTGLGTTVASPTSSGDYGIALEQLVSLTRENNFNALQQYGGVSQLQMYFLLVFVLFFVLCLHNVIVISSG